MESIYFVFFCDQRPAKVGIAAATLLRLLQQSIKLPPAEICAFPDPEADRSQALAGWKSTDTGLLTLSLPRRRFRAEAEEFLSSLPDDVTEISMACPAPDTKRPAFEKTWGISIYAEPAGITRSKVERYADAGVLDTTIAVEINSSHFKEAGEQTRSRLVLSLLQAVPALGRCYYGFIDCEDAEAGNGLWLYSRDKVDSVARHILQREENWWDLGEKRRQMVKYVHWGTYLGPTMATNLTSRLPTLLPELRSWRFISDGDDALVRADNLVQEFEGGGLFLSLTGDVMDASDQYGWMHSFGNRGVQCASLLQRKFREAGMLA